MFVSAIQKINKFTRPIHTILRYYDSNTVLPGAATMFFINDEGWALTCKHVVEVIINAEAMQKKYLDYKKELQSISTNKKNKYKLKKLNLKYGITDKTPIQIRNRFMNCVDTFTTVDFKIHNNYDIALIKFNGYNELKYEDHATFLKDSSLIQQGKTLCRLGYPFPEFTNYAYDKQSDELKWTDEGRVHTPTFPTDGLITRNVVKNQKTIGIEMSTPGLRGQSGGPLFDQNGIIYGMQSSTHHLHMDFDIKEKDIISEGRVKKVSNYPFIHLGHCVHVNIIKEFFTENSIKYFEQ